MFATLMLTHGADLAVVSRLLCHSSVTMTADVNYQYLEGEKERAINLLSNISQLSPNSRLAYQEQQSLLFFIII